MSNLLAVAVKRTYELGVIFGKPDFQEVFGLGFSGSDFFCALFVIAVRAAVAASVIDDRGPRVVGIVLADPFKIQFVTWPNFVQT